MEDLSLAVPVRRTSVARGSLAPLPPSFTFDASACIAAARLAIKRADGLLPDAHGFHAGHIEVTLTAGEGALTATVTVQGHGRSTLDTPALVGVAVALLTARQQSGALDAGIEMALVQNVD